MAITLAQIDIEMDAAWAALRHDEIEYTVQGRTLKFRSLGELRGHINWLMELQQTLTGTADAASGDPLCPVVQFVNSE